MQGKEHILFFAFFAQPAEQVDLPALLGNLPLDMLNDGGLSNSALPQQQAESCSSM